MHTHKWHHVPISLALACKVLLLISLVQAPASNPVQAHHRDGHAGGGGSGGDVTAPSVPQNVVVQAVKTKSLDVSWSSATDNTGVTDYEVDVASDANFNTLIVSGKKAGNKTDLKIAALSANTLYYVRVRAEDAAGNTSPSSVIAQGTTLGNRIACFTLPLERGNVDPIPNVLVRAQEVNGTFVARTRLSYSENAMVIDDPAFLDLLSNKIYDFYIKSDKHLAKVVTANPFRDCLTVSSLEFGDVSGVTDQDIEGDDEITEEDITSLIEGRKLGAYELSDIVTAVRNRVEGL